ncbi:MAG TPA: choice-of-anchor tandem repeat GloVer-containing protein [Rhizomicrobium sp.]|jgi:uncharacterized repeat protein (TIGR03803 family)|nr:choice-of-anchor tandem repeat GloVer-containing protein [Rhizomicrobium sp.]
MRARNFGINSALAAGTALALLASSVQARTVHVLYGFQNVSDGAYPLAGLIKGRSGNLYGTTSQGGTGGCEGGCGTVFKLAPDGTKTILYSFAGGTDGSHPQGLVMDKAGNLYGTTASGGGSGCFDNAGCGTVFEMGASGTKTVLHAFKGANDGGEPLGGLIIDGKGNLYGSAAEGGGGCDSGYGCGAVFRVAPDGKEKVIYGFAGPGQGDGEWPGAVRLARDSAGNIYGTTQSGGAHSYGTVFRLSRDGTETVLYSFTGGSDGGGPYAGVILDAAGNLYGTTPYDGDLNCDYGEGCGTVFKIASDGTETTLYTFTDTGANASPMAPLVMDSAGNLYGTTYGFSPGGVFKLSPSGTEKLLYTFTGGTDGGQPLGGLFMDKRGRLYGTTQSGGGGNCNNGFGCGAVFELRD